MKVRFFIMLVAALGIIAVVYSSVSVYSSKYDESKQVIALRKIAHEVLRLSGDSTSKVLPVKRMSSQEFHIYPEVPFAISPDSFVSIVNKVVVQYGLQKKFTANIVKYQQEETIYGFAVAPFQKDNNTASCLGRELPVDQYYFRFVFSEPEKNMLNNPVAYTAGAALLLGMCYFIFLKKRKPRALPSTTEEDAEGDKQDNCIPIGQYRFYPLQQQLELAGTKTILTGKETKVLMVLASAVNNIIERDTIQKEVWENEGVIVTRSLDMFISKLRKKLSSDENVKIVNVHGKGYKLEISS